MHIHALIILHFFLIMFLLSHKSFYATNAAKIHTKLTEKGNFFYNHCRFREKTDQENGPKAEKNKTKIATGLGRKTREE